MRKEAKPTVFQFGDDRKVFSIGKVIIATDINDHSINTKTEIDEVDIPLLLSREFMKKA